MSIVVDNLVKQYRGQYAVRGVSFEIKTGEIVGFLGPNGAGKSTTMRIITCYISASEGQVLVNGNSVHEDVGAIKQIVGYLAESNPLYSEMSVLDYLHFSARLQGVPSTQISTRSIEMVELCGLSSEKHKKIQELSKGYRQRVGLAQAMIHDPQILILDEPTSGLDPNQIVEIRKLIKELGKKKTVLLSSHILSEVEATCDRIIIINKGRIVANGTTQEIQARQRGSETLVVEIEGEAERIKEVLLGMSEISAIHEVEKQENEPNHVHLRIESKPNVSAKRAVFHACVKEKWCLLEMRTEEKRLEDLFRQLTD